MMTDRLTELKLELAELQRSWEYAFAMGHGCSVGDHPVFQKTREKARYLAAQIREHSE